MPMSTYRHPKRKPEPAYNKAPPSFVGSNKSSIRCINCFLGFRPSDDSKERAVQPAIKWKIQFPILAFCQPAPDSRYHLRTMRLYRLFIIYLAHNSANQPRGNASLHLMVIRIYLSALRNLAETSYIAIRSPSSSLTLT